MATNAKDYQLMMSDSEGSSRAYNESKVPSKLTEFISVVVGALCPLFLVNSHSH